MLTQRLVTLRPVALGDVGFLEKSALVFRALFNAFDPERLLGVRTRSPSLSAVRVVRRLLALFRCASCRRLPAGDAPPSSIAPSRGAGFGSRNASGWPDALDATLARRSRNERAAKRPHQLSEWRTGALAAGPGAGLRIEDGRTACPCGEPDEPCESDEYGPSPSSCEPEAVSDAVDIPSPCEFVASPCEFEDPLAS
jgi:hypothetical protein